MSKEDQPLDFGDDDSDADDVLSLLEGSNNEALVSLDGDVLDGLVEYDGFDEEAHVAVGEDEERGGIGGWFVGLEMQREETVGAKSCGSYPLSQATKTSI